MTTASMRAGLPSTYSTVTWLLPSGRRKSSSPERRTCDKRRDSLCASMIGSGISSVGFIARVAEHQALVARAARIHAHGDIGALGLNRIQHAAGFRVETKGRIGVADLFNGLTHDARDVHVAGGGDLAGDDAMPVVTRTSQATRPLGSCSSTASRTASEIWSAILSGCPSVTDSDVKRCLWCAAMHSPGWFGVGSVTLLASKCGRSNDKTNNTP